MAEGDDAILCVAELEKHSRKHLPKFAFEYFSTGAIEQDTLRENRNAFKRSGRCLPTSVCLLRKCVADKLAKFSCNRLRIHPRVMRGISQVDMRTTVLGQRISMLICVAPTAMQHFAHPQAEIATAKGDLFSDFRVPRNFDLCFCHINILQYINLIA